MLKQTYRYIVAIDGVRSGRAVLDGTRVAVHDLVALFLNGDAVDDVIRSYPEVSRAQVYECLAYYEDHKAELDLVIAAAMAEPSA